MNNFTRIGTAVSILLRGHIPHCRAPHLVNNAAEGLLHMLHLIIFLIAPVIIKPQYGNAPFIYYIGINFTVVLFVRDSFSTAGKSYHRAVVAAVIFLQIFAVTAAALGTIVVHFRIVLVP